MQDWYHEGNRLLNFIQAVQTNDLGEYRLFWLPPGRYYVAARPEDSQNATPKRRCGELPASAS